MSKMHFKNENLLALACQALLKLPFRESIQNKIKGTVTDAENSINSKKEKRKTASSSET